MESNRKQKLKKAQKLREEIIKNEIDGKNTKLNFLTNNVFQYNSNKISPNTTLSKMFNLTKSLNLKEKNSQNENELLLLKKQNLSEIKNLIDFTVKKNNEIKLNEIEKFEKFFSGKICPQILSIAIIKYFIQEYSSINITLTNLHEIFSISISSISKGIKLINKYFKL